MFNKEQNTVNPPPDTGPAKNLFQHIVPCQLRVTLQAEDAIESGEILHALMGNHEWFPAMHTINGIKFALCLG